MLPILHLLPVIASATATTSILLPLYLYPGSDSMSSPNAANWMDAVAAIKAYPKVNWWVVVNPNSGPGFTQYPDNNYIYGMSQLKNLSNVITLGYIETNFAHRPYQNITDDVKTYAGWANYTSANISVNGIFFDDVPNAYNLQTEFPKLQGSNDTYYRNATTFVNDTIVTAETLVMLNTGSPGPVEFYDYGAILVEEEIPYSEWSGQATLDDITTNEGAILNQSAIILNQVPTNLSSADLTSLIRTIKMNNVAFISLTQDCCYNVVNGTFLQAVASAVEGA